MSQASKLPTIFLTITRLTAKYPQLMKLDLKWLSPSITVIHLQADLQRQLES